MNPLYTQRGIQKKFRGLIKKKGRILKNNGRDTFN